jgi:hypothetical protein
VAFPTRVTFAIIVADHVNTNDTATGSHRGPRNEPLMVGENPGIMILALHGTMQMPNDKDRFASFRNYAASEIKLSRKAWLGHLSIYLFIPGTPTYA